MTGPHSDDLPHADDHPHTDGHPHSDGHPPTVVRPRTAAEVAEAVLRARSEKQDITVVAGGHGPWSHAPASGMRIELSDLRGIEIDGLVLDGQDAVVHIGGGAIWGDVATALAADGLAISSGDTASVGVGGLTLGGGIGWMVRAWGLASDQLVGAEIVTADGEIIEVSAEQNADLFWALRGGGGNFGIVTRFDFAAHPLDGIAHADIPIAGDPVAVLRTVRDVMTDAPRELTLTYMDVPAMDPSAPAGARLSAVWAGPDAEALGGAYGEVPQDYSPFPARAAQWFVMAGGFDVPGVLTDNQREAVRTDAAAIQTDRLAE